MSILNQLTGSYYIHRKNNQRMGNSLLTRIRSRQNNYMSDSSHKELQLTVYFRLFSLQAEAYVLLTFSVNTVLLDVAHKTSEIGNWQLPYFTELSFQCGK